MRTLDELTKIANDEGLNLHQTQRFVEFAKLWKGGNESDVLYLHEWASRFRKQCDYVMADNNTRKLLVKVDGKMALSICENQYRRLDWCEDSIQRELFMLQELTEHDF